MRGSGRRSRAVGPYLFIREDNPRSLNAHLRLGMRAVARFDLGNRGFHRLE